MYKLLIVDDEYWVRNRLANTIDWPEVGISEVLVASNGLEALDISMEQKPDIIVTDINMPELSGLELIQALQSRSLNPRIVLISGFNEFEYAHSAIKYGVIDYLLKPVDENELIEIIRNCIEDYKIEEKERELFNSMENYRVELQKKALTDLMSGKMGQPDISFARLKDFGIDFSYNSAGCVIIHPSLVTGMDSSDYVEETLIRFSISNIMKDVIPAHLEHHFLLQMNDLDVIVVFDGSEEQEFLDKIEIVTKTINEELKKLFNINLVFGVGSRVSDILELSESFRAALYKINSYNFKDWNNIINYGEPQKTTNLNIQEVYFDYNLNKIASKIKNRDKEAAFLEVDRLIHDFLSHNDQHPSLLQIKLFYINVMNTLFKECLISGPPTEEFLNLCLEAIHETNAAFTPEKLAADIQKIIGFLLTQYNEFIGNKRHWLLDQITDYIEQNYNQAITMKSVATKFYLNPSYFCKLFKNETGSTFTHYLMKLRIRKAKEMMGDYNMKLYDIAAAVGYENVQYFSTIFKEMVGMTPSQYRNSLNKQPEGRE